MRRTICLIGHAFAYTAQSRSSLYGVWHSGADGRYAHTENAHFCRWRHGAPHAELEVPASSMEPMAQWEGPSCPKALALLEHSYRRAPFAHELHVVYAEVSEVELMSTRLALSVSGGVRAAIVPVGPMICLLAVVCSLHLDALFQHRVANEASVADRSMSKTSLLHRLRRP